VNDKEAVGVSGPLRIEGRLEGQVPQINKAFSIVNSSPHYQTQELSVTENNSLFLIRQKKRFLEK